MSRLLRHRTMMPRFKMPFELELVETYLIGAIQAEVRFRQRNFVFNDSLKEQIHKMAIWLTNDSSKFGMLLCGGCGNGKSTMMNAFQHLLNLLQIQNPITRTSYGMRIIDAKSIVYLYKSNINSWNNLAKAEMLAIDDLGIEPLELLDYGNVISPVIDLLTRRYEEQLFTVITTNLTPPEISARYGERIADRLREMMEKISFTNESYRSL